MTEIRDLQALREAIEEIDREILNTTSAAG